MSALGQVSVRETHGVRRFLYPLSAEIDLAGLPSSDQVTLASPDGRTIPVQVSPLDHRNPGRIRLDFAVSLAPYEKLQLALSSDQSAAAFEDPLNVTVGKTFRIAQRRFVTEFDKKSMLHQVVYDGVRHLTCPSALTRNGETMAMTADPDLSAGPLAARIRASGSYGDGCDAETRLQTTACKSWVVLRHLLLQPRASDEIVFHLQLAAVSPVLTADFGVGGGIYGKLEAGGSEELSWQSDFPRRGTIRWSISAGDRTDYTGEVKTSDEYAAQRWFHLIDRGKSLAVAVTDVPGACREMTVKLRSDGAVQIRFGLGESDSGPAVFGVCCHFLNNIPALAAATNPQSILLPPLVEVSPGFRGE